MWPQVERRSWRQTQEEIRDDAVRREPAREGSGSSQRHPHHGASAGSRDSHIRKSGQDAVVAFRDGEPRERGHPLVSSVHLGRRHERRTRRWVSQNRARAVLIRSLPGAEGFTTEEEHEMLGRIEKQLKRRFAIGTQVSQQNIIQDFTQQQYPERAVLKVIYTMIRRGQLQHRMQRRMLYRIS
jgi:hypothetical protein